MMTAVEKKMSTTTIINNINKSSKSEAPYALAQQLTAIYATMPASESKEETKVIPPDCFF
jgi:hypothetical protein